MGFWSRLIGKSGTATPAKWLVDWVRGGEDVAGMSVTPESAMRLAAVYACVRVRSEDIGKIPLVMYQRQADGGKDRVRDHPLARVMRDQANPYQTAFEFRQLLQAWIDLRGNGYAFKEVDARGRVVALWPINPTWVSVLRYGDGRPGISPWEIFYQITVPGTDGFHVTLPQEDILHVRGMTLDGFVGMSPISWQRETIGLGLAAQRYGASLFGNSAQPNGAIKTPGILSKDASTALRASWEATHKGPDKANTIAILDGGMEWVQTGMTNLDAQYLEGRKLQNQQIYSIFRVPPHKVGDLDKATFSNIEQQALEYVSDCLMTEMVRWEQSLWRDLLTEEEKQKYFFEFMPDALLRGDLPSRSQAYAAGRQWGWYSVNDIRDKENLNRIPDGDVYLQPMNMNEAGAPPPQTPAAPPKARKLNGKQHHEKTADTGLQE